MIVRGFAGAIAGALAGSIVGAFTSGLDTSLAVGSSPMGPTRDWWRLAAAFGAIAGAVIGLGFGAAITLSRAKLQTSVGLGSLVGLLGGIVFFAGSNGVDWQLRPTSARLAPAVLSVVGWMVIGSLLSFLGGKLPR
jgi:hypothetical protein